MYNPKKYKNMTSKLSALKAIIDMANSSNTPQALFPLTSQFSKLTFQDPDFQAPLKKITKEGNKVFATMLKAERDALNELKSHEKTIRKYVTSNNLTNPSILQALDTFQDQLKNTPKLNTLIIPLEHALYTLVNDDTFDHSAFTQTFGKIKQINDDKWIDRADAFPKFHAWNNKASYLAQEKQTATWYSLNQLLVFYERYNWETYDNLIEKLQRDGKDISQLQEEHKALTEYAEFNIPTRLFPTIEEYKNYMLQIYLHIQNQSHVITATPEQPKIIDWSYVIGKRKFSHAGKHVTFREFKLFEKKKKKRSAYGYPSEILKIITQEKNKRKKSWQYLRLFENILGTDPEQTDDQILQAMFDACEQINRQISDKCDLKDFLLYDKDSVRINPRYLN
jgi:hypothetical protein